MAPIEEAFANTLKRFEFGKNKANRWLLMERSKREAVLREAGLLGLIRWEDQPVHVGNIVRVDQRYDWGHVVFRGVIDEFRGECPSSVYAAFEFLIRQCGIFPSFISLADLRRCDAQGLQALAVYGSPFRLDGLDVGSQRAHIKAMLQLHDIEPRDGLLIRQVCEVTDAELFEQYFRDVVERKKQLASHAPPVSDGSGAGLDDINVWHT